MGAATIAGLVIVATACVACVPDDWRFPTPRDAAGDDVEQDAPAPDVAGDAACGEGGGLCEACGPPPVNLYRAEGDARDLFGEQHARVSGGLSYVEGRFGQAFFIDGARQYVAIPSSVGNFGEHEFTIALWFKSRREGVMIGRRAACWGIAGFSGEDFGLAGDGRVAVEVFTYPMGYYVLRSLEGGFNDDRWHHTALMRRGDALELSVDGAVVDRLAVAGDFDDRTQSPSYLGVSRCVASSPGNHGNVDMRTWYVGALDEVAFYTRALSPAELLATARGRCAP